MFFICSHGRHCISSSRFSAPRFHPAHHDDCRVIRLIFFILCIPCLVLVDSARPQEPYDERAAHVSDPVLQLVCLDAGIGMRPIFDKFRTVIITSGTLSPIELYPKLLSFAPKLSESLTMTLSRQCIRPTIVTKVQSGSLIFRQRARHCRSTRTQTSDATFSFDRPSTLH
jgi:hypothetical protein